MYQILVNFLYNTVNFHNNTIIVDDIIYIYIAKEVLMLEVVPIPHTGQGEERGGGEGGKF